MRIFGSHPWALTYVNLGVGNNATSFNITLLDNFNQTGNGTFCISQLGAAVLEELGVQEGTNATIQVIQTSHSGSALYNVSISFPVAPNSCHAACMYRSKRGAAIAKNLDVVRRYHLLQPGPALNRRGMHQFHWRWRHPDCQRRHNDYF